MKKIYEGRVLYSTFQNFGVVEKEGKLYKIKGVIPGQKISYTTKNKSKGTLVDILERSVLEDHTPCDFHKYCGGCSFQTISPKTEIKLKKDSLRLLYKDIAPNHPIILNESPLLSNYRNKMEYSFGDEVKNGPLMLGLHKKNRFYEITDTYNCNIAPKDFDTVRQRVLEYFKDKNSTFFHKKTKIGFLRHLVLRYSFKQREIMLNLVTTSQDKLNEEEFLKILEELPLNSTISNVIHTINDRDSDVVICDKMKILKGSGFIYEEINGLAFKISPFSFFQPNVKTAELIYKKASEFIGDVKDKNILDLYSGTGTISQILAKSANKVIGIEIVQEAVLAARENAKLNKLENVEFIREDVLKEIENIMIKPYAVVMDPPREGINPKAVLKIIGLKPEKFIYISCNPVTQVRDLKIFKSEGYEIKELEFFNQFPRTYHVEAIVLLSKKKNTV